LTKNPEMRSPHLLRIRLLELCQVISINRCQHLRQLKPIIKSDDNSVSPGHEYEGFLQYLAIELNLLQFRA